MVEQTHIYEKHAHALPECFVKRGDVTWAQVHKLLHDLAGKRGEDPHAPANYPHWRGGADGNEV